MSVEVKTPTQTQFGHTEFPCVEPFVNQPETMPPVQTGKGQMFKRQASAPAQNNKAIKKRKFSERTNNERAGTSMFRKRFRSLRDEKSKIKLPTKFLLGGNINDPLNLNSMLDEEVNKALNAFTPQSSPIPLPAHRQKVDVVFPRNITDPLNLNDAENEDEDLVSPKSKKKKKKHKYKKRGSSDGVIENPVLDVPTSDNMQPLEVDVNLAENNLSIGDLIVSPVIPQTSPKTRKKRRHNSEPKPEPSVGSGAVSRLVFQEDNKNDSLRVSPNKTHNKRQSSSQPHTSTNRKSYTRPKQQFIYGNYNRYYGYRNPSMQEDLRLKSFSREWFYNKDILDIGCNVGHVTLAIAQEFKPRKIVGMDIDGKLVSAARKNVRHLLSNKLVDPDKFPMSIPLLYGPMAAPPAPDGDQLHGFPHNVVFAQGNFVLEKDEMLDFVQEEYDTIIALSITKWIHLNWGDDGIKRFFRRIFRQLRPGGHLILEPQMWASYKKRKKLTPAIFENFQSILLRPEQFTEYLLSDVGFSTCEVIGVPQNKAKGFRRPIQLFTKGTTAQSTPMPDRTPVQFFISAGSSVRSTPQSEDERDTEAEQFLSRDTRSTTLHIVQSAPALTTPLQRMHTYEFVPTLNNMVEESNESSDNS